MALVRRCLVVLIGLFPEHLESCAPKILAVRQRLGAEEALITLRIMAARQLPQLPSPLGFHPHGAMPGNPTLRRQQSTGPDPPA
jgi:hypothetical protein